MHSIFLHKNHKFLVALLLFWAGGVFSQNKVTIYSPATGSDKNRDKLPPASIYQAGYSKFAFSGVNERDALAASQLLKKRLMDKTGLNLPFETSIYFDLAEIEKDVRNNNLDLVVLFPEEFIEINKHIALEPILIARQENDIFDEYILLVQKEKNLQKLDDLRNRKIILATGFEGRLPVIWLDVKLRKQKLPVSETFAHTKSVGTVSKAILPVFFGQADACLVTMRGYKTMSELNPQIGRRLQIIARSPKFANGILALNPLVKNEKTTAILEQELFKLSDDAEGRQILKIFKTDDLVPFEPSYLASVRALLKEYNSIKNVHKQKGK